MNTGPPIVMRESGTGRLITESSATKNTAWRHSPSCVLSFHMDKRMMRGREIHGDVARFSFLVPHRRAEPILDSRTRNEERETSFPQGSSTSTPTHAPASWKVARAINLPERSMISTRFMLTAGLTEVGNATAAACALLKKLTLAGTLLE